MQREIMIDVVQILGFNAPCAHHCLYCLMGKQQLPGMTFSRLASVAERFHDWIKEAKSCDFKIRTGPSFSANFDLETTAALAKLWRRLGQMEGFAVLLMGGLLIRPQEEMRQWLHERQALGLKTLVPALAGIGETHDYYNRRQGDFDFLTATLRTGAELGLVSHQRLFLTKRTLPEIEPLLDILVSLPIEAKSRSLYPFYYRGLSDRLEDERITEADRDLLSPRLAGLRHPDEVWRSEREWIGHVLSEKPGQPDNVWLRLHLDESNIDAIEAAPVESIYADLEARTRAAYAAVPSRQQLAERAGDASNTRIYLHREDVERLWLDRYLRDHALEFERKLTYFQ